VMSAVRMSAAGASAVRKAAGRVSAVACYTAASQSINVSVWSNYFLSSLNLRLMITAYSGHYRETYTPIELQSLLLMMLTAFQ
jgi:hypothetical protein